MSTHIIDQLRPVAPEIDQEWEAATVVAILGDDGHDEETSSWTQHRWGRTARFVLVAATIAAIVGGTLVAREKMPRSDVRPAGPVSTATATEGAVTDPGVRAEYEAAEDALGMDFPDDVELPSLADQLGRLPTSANGAPDFEDGFGESLLVSVWRCSWERSFLNAVVAGDADGEARAGHQLSSSYELPVVKRVVSDPDRLWEKEVLTPALAGNTEPLSADLVNSCGPPFAP